MSNYDKINFNLCKQLLADIVRPIIVQPSTQPSISSAQADLPIATPTAMELYALKAYQSN